MSSLNVLCTCVQAGQFLHVFNLAKLPRNMFDRTLENHPSLCHNQRLYSKEWVGGNTNSFWVFDSVCNSENGRGILDRESNLHVIAAISVGPCFEQRA